jgi:hypothetical protein
MSIKTSGRGGIFTAFANASAEFIALFFLCRCTAIAGYLVHYEHALLQVL